MTKKAESARRREERYYAKADKLRGQAWDALDRLKSLYQGQIMRGGMLAEIAALHQLQSLLSDANWRTRCHD